METRQWITTLDELYGVRLSTDSTLECEPFLKSVSTIGTTDKPECKSESWVRKRFQQLVLEQMCMVGWDKIRNASINFSEISLDVSTIRNPNETIVVILNENYPAQCPVIRSSLLRFVPALFSTDHLFSLVDIRNAFMKCMIDYERLMQELRLIDEQAVAKTINAPSNHNAAQPASLTRPDIKSNIVTNAMRFVPINTQRMILVQLHPQVWVTISPDHEHPCERCEVAFSGPAEWRRRYEDCWGHRRHNWDNVLPILKNLENILEVRFPSSMQAGGTSSDVLVGSAHSIEVSASDCSICYSDASAAATKSSSHGDGKAGTRCCNERCVHVYHADCVRKWLASLSVCKISFGTMYGVCPYCASELHVPV